MLRCLPAGWLRREVDVERLKFEVSLICLRETVRAREMDTTSYSQQSSNCYDQYDSTLSALGYCQQQVHFTSFFRNLAVTEIKFMLCDKLYDDTRWVNEYCSRNFSVCSIDATVEDKMF